MLRLVWVLWCVRYGAASMHTSISSLSAVAPTGSEIGLWQEMEIHKDGGQWMEASSVCRAEQLV